MSRKLKKYDITFRSTLNPIHNVANPYNHHDIKNMTSGMRYVFTDGRLETVRIEAPTKRIAESLLAVKLFERVMGLDIKDGYAPFVIDGLRNIESIIEVIEDEQNN